MKKCIGDTLRMGTRLYSIWSHMKQRTTDQNVDRYEHYGGKGIAICKEWKDYEKFKEWALLNGYQDSLTIDRIDNDGNYEPSNCRWADKITQANNTSRNHFIEFNGEIKTIAEWARKIGIKREALYNRIYNYGWSIEKALNTPKMVNQYKYAEVYNGRKNKILL